MSGPRIGLVDLDTSHPSKWVPILRRLGAEVVGVYDSGAVHAAGHADRFAAEFSIPKVFGSVAEMVDHVDVAFVHSCNWDVHVERARPFVDGGKAVLVDKPLAGTVADVRQLLDWERDGARITGGSSVRYCVEARSWLADHDPADVVNATAGCAVDEFNYGIHAYTLAHTLLGPGVESVRHLGSHGQVRVELRWGDDRRVVVSVGETDGSLPFYATVATGADLSHIEVDSTRLYASFLESVLPYLAGDAPAPVPFATVVEPELAAIAALLSERRGGEEIRVRDIPVDDPGFDGAAFEVRYRAKFGTTA